MVKVARGWEVMGGSKSLSIGVSMLTRLGLRSGW